MATKQNLAKRKRAPGAYKKLSISVPYQLYERFEQFVNKKLGYTMSAFMSDAGGAFLEHGSKE